MWEGSGPETPAGQGILFTKEHVKLPGSWAGQPAVSISPTPGSALDGVVGERGCGAREAVARAVQAAQHRRRSLRPLSQPGPLPFACPGPRHRAQPAVPGRAG